MPDKFHYNGIPSLNGTIVPDDVFDVLMPICTGAEFKVLSYIVRRTFGFKKEKDSISLKQMVDGITKKDGEVLDSGTGLAKGTAAVAIKGLVDKGIIEAQRNRSKEKGDEPTTYCLHFEAKYPVSENQTRGGTKNGQGGVLKSDTQQTVLQDTEIQYRNSSINTRNRSDDNKQSRGDSRTITEVLKAKYQPPKEEKPKLEAPEEIKAVMGEISQEFGDRRHLHANITQVMNIVEKSGRHAETFSTFLYQAKSITKQQPSVKKKMPYFFKVLKETVEV